jgi:hypothetical protein
MPGSGQDRLPQRLLLRRLTLAVLQGEDDHRGAARAITFSAFSSARAIGWKARGPGNAADATFSRTGAGAMQLLSTLALQVGTAGFVLKVAETSATPTSPPVQFIGAGAGDRSLGIEVTGDTKFRLRVDTNGRHDWASGSAGSDVSLLRSAANTHQLLTADLDIATAGRDVEDRRAHERPQYDDAKAGPKSQPGGGRTGRTSA